MSVMIATRTGRLKHYWQVLFRPTWALVWLLVFGLLGSLITFRDEFLPDTLKSKLRVLNVLPDWNWGWWVLAFSAVLVLVLLESSYRIRGIDEARRDELRDQLDAIGIRRPIDFVRLGIEAAESAALISINAFSIEFENKSDEMLKWSIEVHAAGVNGTMLPLQGAQDQGFIGARSERRYSASLSVPLAARHLPFTFTVDYTLTYDNEPPVREREHHRTIEQTFRSLNPIEGQNRVLAQAER